jgi:membrane-associated phospholipid phosphatase
VPQEDQAFRYFFQNLVRDIKGLPSKETAWILGTATGVALIAHPVDDNLQIWVEAQEPAGYTAIGRVAGDGWVQGGAALATYGVGVLSGHAKVRHIGSDLIRSQMLNAILTRGLKLVANRERPSGGSSDSMPSGHASASFTTAAILGSHFGPRVGIPSYAFAGFIGWTRIRDNAHWLTDVIIGGAIGTTVGLTVARGHRDSAWTVVPTVTPNHVAIHVVRIGN